LDRRKGRSGCDFGLSAVRKSVKTQMRIQDPATTTSLALVAGYYKAFWLE